jgi:hypothetical protein
LTHGHDHVRQVPTGGASSSPTGLVDAWARSCQTGTEVAVPRDVGMVAALPLCRPPWFELAPDAVFNAPVVPSSLGTSNPICVQEPRKIDQVELGICDLSFPGNWTLWRLPPPLPPRIGSGLLPLLPSLRAACRAWTLSPPCGAPLHSRRVATTVGKNHPCRQSRTEES